MARGLETSPLRDLLYSRLTLPHLLCGTAVQLTLAVRISHPSQHTNSVLCLLIQRPEESYMARKQSEPPAQWDHCCVSNILNINILLIILFILCFPL